MNTEDCNTGVGICQGAKTGDVGLSYKPFDFRAKRIRAAAIARAADAAGMPDRGDKYSACGRFLQFGCNETGRHLAAANFCHQRFCPICAARLARANSKRLARVLTVAQEAEPVRYLFLTLAPRSVPVDKLSAGVDQTLDGWARLMRMARIKRACLGSYRSLEITRNRATGAWHPHIHAIFAVPHTYFSDKKLYLSQQSLISLFRAALRVDYAPTAHISALYAKGEDGKRVGDTDTSAAVREAAKYSVKDSDILAGLGDEQRGEMYRTLFDALDHRRLSAYTGLLREVAHALKADDDNTLDLIHSDEDEDEDLTKLSYAILESWAWQDSLREYECVDVCEVPHA